FFSSRRRHTRSYGDWSSDVCSSDLSSSAPLGVVTVGVGGLGVRSKRSDDDVRSISISAAGGTATGASAGFGGGVFAAAGGAGCRSEERRVGKECRGGGWAECMRRMR